MAIFSTQQVNELLAIIARRQLVLIATQLGSATLTDEEVARLVEAGVPVASLPREGTLDTSFKFGMLSEALGHERAKGMSYEQLKRFLASGEFVPLNARERFVLNSIKTQSLADIRGLGARMQQDVAHLADRTNNALRSTYEEVIRDKAKLTAERRKGVKFMVSEIGHKTGDWGRDFDRISDYVTHRAYDEGRAASIAREHGDGAMVYKLVQPSACRHCVRLYLKNGEGSEPKLFKLTELVANGTNIGRKAADWKPVIGCTHPYCRCTLMYAEEGYAWNEQEGMFTEGEFERKVKRRSKITVTVGDKKTII